jgi:hypothetical protein
MSGGGQVAGARVHCVLDGRRLEVDASALGAARTGVREARDAVRAHWENRRPETLVALVEAPVWAAVDPQPAIATRRMEIAIQSELTRALRIMRVASRCTPAGVTAA